MTVDSARQALFGDTLTCDELRPAAFLPGVLDGAALASCNARGEALLQSLAVVEDGMRGEEPEQPSDYALHRLEAKVDLLMALVAGLCASQDDDPMQPLQWSARGASLVIAAPVPVGSTGRFRVRPSDWLPSPLVLPATVLACDADAEAGTPANTHAGSGTQARVWLRFGPLSPALDAALERHLFRVHRRAVAESRRPR